ncbi:polysaccharide deacetylase [Pseudoroseomonas cervicalis]|uniref:polysaccharide deacetylase n=1 Tax=Teichococcus cervicalis TaxID=204525 RepID=UPI0022F15676|nr:polysaccharide deacetylase [Pseudoroseomonas cervicalis]WBV45536.1 polysaccharide deacetylase [Pseudoroseomonas cervicalis]
MTAETLRSEPAETPPYVPLALEAEDVAAYAAMAEAMGCSLEACAEGFMMATPLARELAVKLWLLLQRLRELSGLRGGAPGEEAALRDLQLQEGLQTLRRVLGLDPDAMPHDVLAEAGLRYRL